MKTEKIWFAIDVETDADTVDAIEFALSENGALGTEIDLLGKKDVAVVKVVGYFEEEPDLDLLRGKIAEALEIYDFPADSVKTSTFRVVENQDWLAEWKKHWKPTITDKFIIAPPWEEIEDSDKIVIKIEPSMAFGTGTHETTRLCLKRIEENFRSEMSFLDVGTGTGILAIAAAKMRQAGNGHGRFLGCDTDEDSIKIAKENAELNGAPEAEFYIGSIAIETPEFDFVCANLTADVIVPILPLLVKKFGKFLVLSGILKEQENWVVGELEKLNIKEHSIEHDGEWISIEITG